ncbi:MAG: type II toxin-antitoxin system VapC family toxin [Aquihabitans sp.]
MPLIVDTGPLYALLDRRDDDHERSLELLTSHPGPLFVPMLVVAEVAYFIERRLRPEVEIRLLGDLSSGTLFPEPVAPRDWLRMAELVAQYRDLGLGTTDASVIAAAERIGTTEIATLDRRHFTVVQAAPGPLTLLP